jgi:hypothetical protein
MAASQELDSATSCSRKISPRLDSATPIRSRNKCPRHRRGRHLTSVLVATQGAYWGLALQRRARMRSCSHSGPLSMSCMSESLGLSWPAGNRSACTMGLQISRGGSRRRRAGIENLVRKTYLMGIRKFEISLSSLETRSRVRFKSKCLLRFK